MARTVNLMNRSKDDLLVIAERACTALRHIAENMTSNEADREDPASFCLPIEEVIEDAHDSMIGQARRTLDSIIREFPPKLPES